jgi:hypothetical protein
MVTQRNARPKEAIGFTLLLAAAITPTMLVQIPAMEDYLDHLGRMYVLTTAGTSDANPYYQVSWALYPDLAMDIVVPQLARFMDIESAGRLFFFTAQFLIVTGCIALEFSVKRRHQISGFAAMLALYSLPFSLGLVNFEFGTGVALWGIASWIALSGAKKWRLRFIVHIIFSCVLFLAHFFAVGIYGLVVGIFELRRIFELRFNVRQVVATIFLLACPIVPMLLLMLWSGASVGENDNQWWFNWKPIWFAFFLNGYSPVLASVSSCALVLVLLYGAIKGSLSLSIDGKWIAFGLLVVFIAMPFKLFGSRMADIRMIAAAILILPAFINLAPRPNSFTPFAGAVIVALILVNVSYVGYVWTSYQNDYKAIKASFALLRQNAFVLVGSTTPHDTTLLMDAPMWRAPTLAVHYAKAFVSSLYTVPGTHAVEVKSEWQHLDINNKSETYEPASLATLKKIAEGENVPSAPQYIRNWQNDFEYVYLLGPHTPNALPKILVEIAESRRFTLYRVTKNKRGERQ